MDRSNYYNVKEVSQILKVSEETVRRWARSGKLSGIQKSRKDGFIFLESEIVAFLMTSPKYALRNIEFDYTIFHAKYPVSCEGARTCIQKTKAIIDEIKHIDELMKYLDSRKKQLIQQYYAIKPE